MGARCEDAHMPLCEVCKMARVGARCEGVQCCISLSQVRTVRTPLSLTLHRQPLALPTRSLITLKHSLPSHAPLSIPPLPHYLTVRCASKRGRHSICSEVCTQGSFPPSSGSLRSGHYRRWRREDDEKTMRRRREDGLREYRTNTGTVVCVQDRVCHGDLGGPVCGCGVDVVLCV